ncbi:polar amino acid transport system substrate-binding protein [Streptomyces sp. TverLS-915]|uniref:ABC transporter substrate-binding protein n=1 Tax=Streptomyces sp. TverLS-915 TaxID=1839763 RepID=UPI00081DB8D4|nr:ABC transporter substrate-binding protein [Streptomyces sp. TverLS-915]SCD44546.1 polar amino acid transport system substrate-binding protein [Streptomyces sp. TverLS-915]
MSAPPPRSARRYALLALLTASALASLTACGSGDPAGPASGGGGAAAAARSADNKAGKLPNGNVVAGVKKDATAARLLPERVREAGRLTLGGAIGAPPTATYLEDGKTAAGVDVEITEAVAKVLGIRIDRQEASFEAILPALGSGKYDVGTGNFGVTDERRKTIDFVTYINDGQGFATRADEKLPKITDLTQLCGKNIGTGAGTTFEVTLEQNKSLCEKAGKKPYSVKTYSEQGAIWGSLQQGRTDVVMSTINGLRYAVDQQQGLKFLNEYHRLDVGFAFKKGSDLTHAFQKAVNVLIADGTYARILKKWGVSDSALPTSRISPPEIR